MQQVLFNLALIDANTFCQNNSIDCSGTHLVKNRYGYVYTLIRDTDSHAVVTVEFHKSSVPTHIIHKPIIAN